MGSAEGEETTRDQSDQDGVSPDRRQSVRMKAGGIAEYHAIGRGVERSRQEPGAPQGDRRVAAAMAADQIDRPATMAKPLRVARKGENVVEALAVGNVDV